MTPFAGPTTARITGNTFVTIEYIYRFFFIVFQLRLVKMPIFVLKSDKYKLITKPGEIIGQGAVGMLPGCKQGNCTTMGDRKSAHPLAATVCCRRK